MAMRIDLATRTIAVSVRDLAGEDLRAAPAAPQPGRAALGQREHARVQAERAEAEEGFAREVHVRYETEALGFRVIVRGRIDGVVRRDGEVRLEEIKTVIEDPVAFEASAGVPRVPEAWIRQVRLYGAILLACGAAERVRIALTVVNLAGRKVREIDLAFDPDAAGELLRERIEAIASEGVRRLDAAARRRAAAEAIRFPFPSLRRGQGAMIEAVEAAIAAGRHLLLSAPAGVGKTAAVLFAACREACRRDLRIFYITAKTTQQALVAETLERLRAAGAPVTAVVLRAKEKLCPQEALVCHPRACALLEDYPLRLHDAGVLDHLLAEGIVRPERIEAGARAYALCPFELSLDLALEVDGVVADYNYVFDPRSYLRRFFAERRFDDAILLVDEAHNLPGRGRDAYSPGLQRARVRGLIRALRGREGALEEARRLAERLDRRLRAIVKAPAEGDGPPPQDEVEIDRRFFLDARGELEEIAIRYAIERRTRGTFQADDPFDAFYWDYAAFASVLDLWGEEFLAYADRASRLGALRILCRDPSRLLGERIRGFRSAIAFSATLEPAEFHRALLGLEPERTDAVRLPSPFPRRNRIVRIAAGLSTRYRDRDRTYPQVAALVHAMALARRGNCLAFLPSFAFLREIERRLPQGPYRLLVQAPSMDEAARARLLAHLAEPGGHHLVLAVQGGIFAEGVDYPGERLVGAIVVGPGLPQVGFVREALRAYFEARYGAGFAFAYAYPGMTRVVQSVGRVIRSETDRGAILLVGDRFTRRPYRDLLPRDWYEEDPEELLTRRPLADIAAFWAEPPAG